MAPETASTLPAAPLPDPEARERALAVALARFDGVDAGAQGNGARARPRRRNASPETAIMARSRLAVATIAIALLAAPLAWEIARERERPVAGPVPAVPDTPPPPRADAATADAATGRPAGPERTVPGPAAGGAPPVAEAPRTAEAPAPKASPVERQVAELRQQAAEAAAARQEASRRETADRQAAAPAPAPRPAVEAFAAQALRSRSLTLPEGRAALPGLRPVAPMAALDPGGAVPRRVAPADAVAAPEPTGDDRFPASVQSGFHAVREQPVLTFSIDVDTASYGFVRAALNRNVLPPKDAVRTEELINYFPYAYEGPASAAEPFRIDGAVFPSPWAKGRKIVRIGIKGYAVQPAERPAANLVFLIDTSGSMGAPNRLPLVKQALAMLLTQLDARDRVAIVTYAGRAGIALEPTSANESQKILGVIDGLEAGGGTAGGEGIRQAYALAERSLDPKGVNRVVLATDGDFNIGITGREALTGFVERERGKGIYLSVLGFGMGNYNDALMQALAQNGNGAAAYIDTLNEARKVLVEEATSTLIPIAKDVKIQVEFNPETVAEYRQIGYETRALAREDFSNDAVDAGEVGSGQSVTALYEIVPAGGPTVLGKLRYGPKAPAPVAATAGDATEYAHVALRYKRLEEAQSRLIETAIGRAQEAGSFEAAPQDARFATAVAGFAEILRGAKYTGGFSLDDVARVAAAAKGEDPFGYRAEFVQLVRAAKTAKALAPLQP